MQINNWLDFTTYNLFTLAVVVIGIPLSIYLFKKGIQGFVKYRFNRLPENYLIVPGLGTYSVEVFFYGIVLFIFVVWYLFFDRGGALVNLIRG